jgi:hypothetical protein
MTQTCLAAWYISKTTQRNYLHQRGFEAETLRRGYPHDLVLGVRRDTARQAEVQRLADDHLQRRQREGVVLDNY